MPIHKVRVGKRVGCQFGRHGKIYFGPSACGKAFIQAKAVYAKGYGKRKKR